MENSNENVRTLKTNTEVMTIKDWVITLLLASIPFVGIIMLFIYAFGDNSNENKRNWARAQLIVAAVILALVILFYITVGAIIFAMLSSF